MLKEQPAQCINRWPEDSKAVSLPKGPCLDGHQIAHFAPYVQSLAEATVEQLEVSGFRHMQPPCMKIFSMSSRWMQEISCQLNRAAATGGLHIVSTEHIETPGPLEEYSHTTSH